jgi:AraC family transcriptional regulator
VALGTHGPGRFAYRLRGLWQLHLYPYATSALIDGVRLDIHPGCAGITPPNAEMRYDLAQVSSHVYAHVALPPGPLRVVPALVDLGPAYADLEQRLLAASAWVERDPPRAAARVWDVLASVLALAPDTAATNTAAHNVVMRARDRIEALLPGAISIAQVAADIGCSHAHLSRAFRATMGCSVVAHVRQRRLTRATHLLRASSLPIAEIARQVGVPDLHAFNKLMRRELGAAPRRWREKQLARKTVLT